MDAIVAGPPGASHLAPPRCRGIRREAEARFRRSGYLALSDVACDVHDGVVHLRGRLPSYYLKQVAQAVAAEVEGVRLVVNRIEVTAPTGCDRAEPRRDSLN
jgi:osmotically-inducible protein OsmY